MAPRTLDGLTHGTASDGHIRLGNPEFANMDGPTPMFTFGPGQILHPKGLDFVVYNGHVLRTAPSGRFLELTHISVPVPSYASGHG
jgi:hypothetical protein